MMARPRRHMMTGLLLNSDVGRGPSLTYIYSSTRSGNSRESLHTMCERMPMRRIDCSKRAARVNAALGVLFTLVGGSVGS